MASFISENVVLVLAFVILLIMIINLELKTTFSSIKKLTIDELTALINSSRVLLIDLRKTDDYHKGHIVNAKNCSIDELESLKINKIDYDSVSYKHLTLQTNYSVYNSLDSL